MEVRKILKFTMRHVYKSRSQEWGIFEPQTQCERY